MPAPQRAKLRAAPAEVELGGAVVDDVGLDELDPFELGSHRVAERLEELEVAGALQPQLFELRSVVDGHGCVDERLRAVAVLGVEVRQRQEQPPAGGELLCVAPHGLAVSRPHAGVDDERSTRPPRTIPTFGTSGTRPSGMTKTPSATSLGSFSMTGGGGGSVAMTCQPM